MTQITSPIAAKGVPTQIGFVRGPLLICAICVIYGLKISSLLTLRLKVTQPRATGLPQPRPKFDPSGADSISSWEYPTDVPTASAKLGPPQQPVPELQRAADCAATLPYRSRTVSLIV